MAICRVGRLLVFAALLALTSLIPAQIKNPFDGAAPATWTRAKEVVEQVKGLPESSWRTNLIFVFSSIEATLNQMQSGNHPLCLSGSRLSEDTKTIKAEGDRYDAEVARYRADVAAYNIANGNVKTDADAANVKAWHDRLEKWWTVNEAWRQRYNASVEDLKKRTASLQSGFDKEYADWVDRCEHLVADSERGLKFAEIDAKIEAKKKQIVNDRRELDRYVKMPDLYKDIEAMAQQAEDARIEGRDKAINQAIGLALDGAIKQVDAREKLARSQLRLVKETLIKHGVRPEDAKKVLKGWFDAPKSVPAIRHTKELLEQLGTLRDVAAAYDATTQRQYWEALASCLGIFVQTPVLKLALSNFEIYSSLMYTGLSYATARARVNQYSKLGDQELKAVASVSRVYQLHFKQLKELEKQRAAL